MALKRVVFPGGLCFLPGFFFFSSPYQYPANSFSLIVSRSPLGVRTYTAETNQKLRSRSALAEMKLSRSLKTLLPGGLTAAKSVKRRFLLPTTPAHGLALITIVQSCCKKENYLFFSSIPIPPKYHPIKKASRLLCTVPQRAAGLPPRRPHECTASEVPSLHKNQLLAGTIVPSIFEEKKFLFFFLPEGLIAQQSSRHSCISRQHSPLPLGSASAPHPRRWIYTVVR